MASLVLSLQNVVFFCISMQTFFPVHNIERVAKNVRHCLDQITSYINQSLVVLYTRHVTAGHVTVTWGSDTRLRAQRTTTALDICSWPPQAAIGGDRQHNYSIITAYLQHSVPALLPNKPGFTGLPNLIQKITIVLWS